MWDCIRYYLKNTGIPINFGITIAIALIVGTVVAGQTFYLFTLENLKQFGALKAIGVTNGRADRDDPAAGRNGRPPSASRSARAWRPLLRDHPAKSLPTRGFVLMWQNVALTGACILFVAIVASLLSIRRVLVLEPAAVFRG